MMKGLKVTMFAIAFTLALWLGGGCVKTTRLVMDKEGRTVEETTSIDWTPSVIVYDTPPAEVVYYRLPARRPVVHYVPYRGRVVAYSAYHPRRFVRSFYQPSRPVIYPARYRHHR